MTIDTQIGSIYSDLDFRLRKDQDGKLKLVVDQNAVEQSIDAILLTPLGSRVFLREFGSRIHDLVFEPLTIETAIKIRNEVRRAINRWDPRLQLVKVEASIDPEGSNFFIEIYGYVLGLVDFSYSRIIAKD